MPTSLIAIMVMCVVAVLAFEFVNGFHDTANAVATVIYTKTLKPIQAVIWSGFWNFLGVWLGGIAIAMSIIGLLPLTELSSMSIGDNVSMVMSILITAIAWNMFTWYKGIPCSSSHTLIGAILGAGLGFYVANGGAGVNWSKAGDIGMALLLSPAFGFSVVIGIMFLMRALIKNNTIFEEPKPGSEQTPPWTIRLVLITTCTLVSFFHGSNDGQKGVGMLMIVLLAFAPMHYALNSNVEQAQVLASLTNIQTALEHNKDKYIFRAEIEENLRVVDNLKQNIADKNTSAKEKIAIKKRIQLLRKNINTLIKDPAVISASSDRKNVKKALNILTNYTDFAPTWGIFLIASSLGLGTMIGWKRIVVTIGEKIGKTHLTYAQGAASELAAAATIGLSTGLGMPVSTTHVLSSGIAGSMVAGNGVKNLQKSTIVNIAMAWVLTLPITILGAMLLFLGFSVLV